MGKRKQKIVFDEKKSKQKRVFNIPTAPATQFHKDKSIYSRKKKHKKDLREYDN